MRLVLGLPASAPAIAALLIVSACATPPVGPNAAASNAQAPANQPLATKPTVGQEVGAATAQRNQRRLPAGERASHAGRRAPARRRRAPVPRRRAGDDVRVRLLGPVRRRVPNLLLSAQRAEATKIALVARGIPADRLLIRAYGESDLGGSPIPMIPRTAASSSPGAFFSRARSTSAALTSFPEFGTVAAGEDPASCSLSTPSPVWSWPGRAGRRRCPRSRQSAAKGAGVGGVAADFEGDREILDHEVEAEAGIEAARQDELTEFLCVLLFMPLKSFSTSTIKADGDRISGRSAAPRWRSESRPRRPDCSGPSSPARADAAAAVNRCAHRLEQPAPRGRSARRRRRKDRKFAGPGARHATGHRAVDQRDARRARPAASARVSGDADDISMTTAPAVRLGVISATTSPTCRLVGRMVTTASAPAAAPAAPPGAVPPTLAGEARGTARNGIRDRHLEPGLHQVGGHRPPHVADPDEGDAAEGGGAHAAHRRVSLPPPGVAEARMSFLPADPSRGS